MGILDQLVGTAGGSGEKRTSLLDLASRLIQNQPGGLSGLIQQFNSSGLGKEAASWVSTGQNLPASADQIVNAIGRDKVEALCSKLGLNSQTASAGLAAILPTFIDHLTPKGQVEHGTDLASALNAIKNKLTT